MSKLVYFESHQYVNDAIKRETQFKKWNCQWKINLIEEENKDWKDLSEDYRNEYRFPPSRDTNVSELAEH